MSEYLTKCTVCGGLLDEEDLFCANCGTESPDGSGGAAARDSLTATHNFHCQGCGASMSYDASAQTLRCPFCGSQELTTQEDAKVLAPNRIVPFAVDRPAAMAVLRRWLGNGFWRPGDLSRTAAIDKMAAVYVPYWVFAARTATYWTADSSQTPLGARGDWYPLFGEHHGAYAGLLVGASGVLTPSETASLCPFDLSAGKMPHEVDTDNAIYEQFRVQRKYARPLAQQGLEEQERHACTAYVPGRCRQMKVNVRLEGLTSEPVLLPVWIVAYRYRDQLFRFLINGQTGQASGQAPVSWAKVFGVVAIVGFVLLLLCLALLGMAA